MIRLLTSLRFFAAFLVYLSHMYHFNYFGMSGLSKGIFQELGNTGVSIFFVLSGFILTHSYHFEDLSIRRFYGARVARIYPAFFVCLVLSVPIEVLSPTKSDHFLSFIANATLTHCFFKFSCLSYNDVDWALSVEVFFYLVFPLLIVYSKEKIIKAVGIVALGILFIHMDKYFVGGFYASNHFPLNRFFEFSLGIMSYFLFKKYKDGFISQIPSLKLNQAILLIIPMLILIPGYFRECNIDRAPYLITGILSSALILALSFMDKKITFPLLVDSTFLYLGELSFSFYLVHNLFLRYMIHSLENFGVEASILPVVVNLSIAFFAFFVILILSHLLYEYVETPCRKKIKMMV